MVEESKRDLTRFSTNTHKLIEAVEIGISNGKRKLIHFRLLTNQIIIIYLRKFNIYTK